MAEAEASEGTTDPTQNDGGVLANLPRTRPQRSSPRRAAARDAASANGRPDAPGTRSRSNASTRTGKAARAKREPAEAPTGTGATATETTGAAGRPAPVADSAATAQARSAGASTRPSSAVRAQRARGAKRAATPRRPVLVDEPAPRQGFECEGERAQGPVPPPGAPEVVASAAELVGELAKAGLSVGERVLKDVFSRLPGG
ncbi:MAG TPA: hypothetical protein VN672_12695 [Solirubrobacteraceae bacterium]|nr:hypothetical protein [Solirubrobacteraceae bacterium]